MTAANEKDLLGRFLESLSDVNPKTRMEAADNIGGLGRGAGRIAVLALGETLAKDRYPPVRCAAARARARGGIAPFAELRRIQRPRPTYHATRMRLIAATRGRFLRPRWGCATACQFRASRVEG